MTRYFTIGMAGHIDHGKTALTKALTGISTDQLKEEKARNISIELGFAPFIDEENLHVSIIDVPGHENFIRQMIAGVAGIDMVILVIAADEGIMPQTKEHLDILSLLGIQQGIIVMTKMDQVDDELLEIVMDDVQATLADTFLHDASIYYVDSLSETGIPALKEGLKNIINQMTKKVSNTPFRLPIDHVFTVKGQGVIVRGTIYNGMVHQRDQLTILPANKQVRVRQIQRHQQEMTTAFEGQRAAINIGGITLDEVARGDVLVANDYYAVSSRIDVVFQALPTIQHKIKQRQTVKLHIGTREVMGRIIFFDRNEIEQHEASEVLCQIHLENPIVVARDDRFIVRRPTPAETIGGGWVIESNAEKHRFGPVTIQALTNKKDGSIKDRILDYIEEHLVITAEGLSKFEASSNAEIENIKYDLHKINNNLYTLDSILQQVNNRILYSLTLFHEKFPMRFGMNKAELISTLKEQYPTSILEYSLKFLESDDLITVNEQYISLIDVIPTYPPGWEKKLKAAESTLIQQGADVDKWTDLLQSYQLPPDLEKEFYFYLLQTNQAYIFDDERIISQTAVKQAVEKLHEHTNGEDFTLQTAREILQLSRKNLVPLLELSDKLGYTKRVDNVRRWVNESITNN